MIVDWGLCVLDDILGEKDSKLSPFFLVGLHEVSVREGVKDIVVGWSFLELFS